MHHLLRAEGVLEDVFGLSEAKPDVAPAQLEIERDVSIAASLQVLEVGKLIDLKLIAPA